MHHAPAVCYPVGRSRFHLMLIVLLGALGAFALSGWMAVLDVLSARHLASACIWLTAVVWAAWAWWRSPQGELAYGGDGWSWTQAGQTDAVSVHVELDLQQTLLLRVVKPTYRPLWLWLERRRSPMHWQALRCAVFAPAPTPMSPSDQGSAA